MEDKRTLLAFLIIGLILLLLPYYNDFLGLTPEEDPSLAPPMEESPSSLPSEENTPPSLSPAPSLTPSTVSTRDPIPTGDLSTTTPAGEGESFLPRQIVVQTPLQQLTFSTEGGVLTSCQLLQYQHVDGRQVELIPSGGRGLSLTLQRVDDTIDLSRVEFVPDMESVSLGEGDQGTLRLSARVAEGKNLVKVLTFYSDRYGFDLDLLYRGYDEDTEANITWVNGIATTERDPEIDLRETRVFSFFNEDLTEIRVDPGDEEESWGPYRGDLQWAGVRNKYFLSAVAPKGEGRFRVLLRGKGTNSGPLPDYSYEVGTRLSSAGTWHSLVYLGPLNYDNLIRYEVELEQAIDFGYPVVRQITKLLLIIFKATYSVIPNYGWIIVLFGLVIKIIVYPLTHKTYESTAKMQELQPKIASLREKFKNDNQRLSKETMKLYKEEGVNPLGGCLPLVLQMPIFFSLYNLFGRTIELRQSPFILWITDLSLPDEVFVAGFGVHILPLLMAVSMLVQQKMTMKDPKQAAMVYLMPVVMIFIFWNMTSGLVLYWTVFNLLTILQQVLINHFKKQPTALVQR
jgi:YidC/Oxa1 family membrane protein insertase